MGDDCAPRLAFVSLGTMPGGKNRKVHSPMTTCFEFMITILQNWDHDFAKSSQIVKIVICKITILQIRDHNFAKSGSRI